MQSQNAAADYHFIYNSVINKSVEAFEIFFFKNVSSEVYGRSSLGYQATNEIVQNLYKKNHIRRNCSLCGPSISLIIHTQFLCGPLMYCDAFLFLWKPINS